MNGFNDTYEDMQEQEDLETPEPPDLVTFIEGSFTATPSSGAVDLAWQTETETNNAGFKVWRGQLLAGETECSTNAASYTQVKDISPWIASEGTEVAGSTYTYRDSGVVSGNTYCYALEDVDFDGTHTFHLDNIASATVQ